MKKIFASPEDIEFNGNDFPYISVIIPVRNEERFIAQTLRQLLEQEYPKEKSEFLVCDGRSADNTRRIVECIAETDSRVRLLDNPKGRSSAARNVGFKAAVGEIFVVVDGHVYIGRPSYLASIARIARQSGADCLGRPQPLIPSTESLTSKAIVLARNSSFGHSPDSLIFSNYEGPAKAASMGAAYLPHVFSTVGFVDESFDACEDLEFNTRIDLAGLSCYTSPDLSISYYARSSIPSLFRQMFRYGFGRFKYFKKHPTLLSPVQIAPFLFCLGLFLLPILAIINFDLFTVGAFTLGAYGMAIFLISLRISSKNGILLAPFVFLALNTIILGLGLGFGSSLIRRGKL